MSHNSKLPECFNEYLTEYYEVEKSIEIVTNEIPSKRIRIDALRADNHYCTSAYIQEHVVMQPMYPRENGEYLQKPREMEVWVNYSLPWTHRDTADQAINQAIGFLCEGIARREKGR